MIQNTERSSHFPGKPLVISMVLLMSAQVYGEESVISQKNKKFSPELVEAKLQDTLVFVNDDGYAHNLYSETPGFEFNVRKQMPGETHRMTLEKSGTFDIRCVIHPRMKMTVVVK